MVAKFRILILITVLMVLFGCAGERKAATATPDGIVIPAEYRALYEELSSKLGQLQERINSVENSQNPGTRFGVELLVANSNRGEILLTERVFKATVLTLDRLQSLGVQCVALSIQVPVLVRSQPRSGEYLSFYRRVVSEIRQHGLAVIIEMGTLFREPEFSKLRVDYSQLTLEKFKLQLREMAQIIVTDLKPDYLTILTEPDTQSQNTGLDFSVSNFASTIQYVVQGLHPSGVKLGAGAGTWSPMGYFNALSKIEQLDFIDLHIYPIQRDFVINRVDRIARTAAGHGKEISIGEAWLYKVSQNELGRIKPTKAFARDVYSFWQPLDSRFIEMLVGLGLRSNAEFCSLFWMKYLYGYIDYNSSTRILAPQQLINRSEAAAGRRILENKLNQTGQLFKGLISK
ncbi:MAG: hypothetical protein WBM69_05625 [Desulfobacterales bacterium]